MSDDGRKFICKKCGETFYEMPTSHGVCFMTIYPNKPKSARMCDGEVVPISKETQKK